MKKLLQQAVWSRLFLMCVVALLVVLSAPSADAQVLKNFGRFRPEVSDDFEDPNWGFNYSANVSSNGLWYGSFRGAPDMLARQVVPAGHPAQIVGNGMLRMQTVDWPGNGSTAGQDDLVTQGFNRADRLGFYPTPADVPLVYAHIYLPPRSSWSASTDYSAYGFRLYAYSRDNEGLTGANGDMAPSFWFYYLNWDNRIWLEVSNRDGWSTERGWWIPGAGGWYTVGFMVGVDGYVQFLMAAGIVDLTPAHVVQDAADFAPGGHPAGHPARAHRVAYGFHTLGYPASSAACVPISMERYQVHTLGSASVPVPADSVEGVSKTMSVSWNAGMEATSHAVYFGTTPTLGAGDFQGDQAGTAFDPGPLEYEMTYYWRIDETNSAGVSVGQVWSFTTGAQPPPVPQSIPFEESFESIPVGEKPSPAAGWSYVNAAGVSVTDDADLLAALAAHGGPYPLDTTHTKVLAVKTGSSTTLSVGSGSATRVEMELMLYPTRWGNADLAPLPDPENQAGFYFDTEGRLAVLHAATEEAVTFNNEWHVLESSPVLAADAWARLTIAKDYDAKMFQVRLDGGSPLTSDKGWSRTSGGTRPGSWFYMANRERDHLSFVSVQGKGALDDVRIHAPAPPAAVAGPAIPDGAVEVVLSSTLGWAPVEGATEYEVYFGTSPELGAGDFHGVTSGGTFSLGTLLPGTTYYWRIDVAGSGGTTPGAVWSFQTLPDTPPRLVGLSIVDGKVRLAYTGNEVGAEIPYVLLHATSLTEGDWSVVDADVPRTAGPEETRIWEHPAPPEGARFYKLNTARSGGQP